MSYATLFDLVPEASEEWRAVLGFEGFYEVSNKGHLRSLPRPRVRPHVLVPNPSTRYLSFNLWRGGRRVTQYVHRLVLEAFVGPCPDGCEARHLNGDRLDNRVENLAWGTRLDNMRDKQRHGTHPTGERSVLSKLTRAQVAEIRRVWTPGSYRHAKPRRGRITLKALADRFGVSMACIRDAARGRTWAA